MSQQLTCGVAALGNSGDQSLSDLESAGSAPDRVLSTRTKEARIHVRGDGRIGKAELSLDGQPHRDVRHSHEDLAADHPSGPFERGLKGSVDTASAWGDGMDHEIEVACKSMLSQQRFQITLGARALRRRKSFGRSHDRTVTVTVGAGLGRDCYTRRFAEGERRKLASRRKSGSPPRNRYASTVSSVIAGRCRTQ
jgi:hypothetical protein